MKRFFKRHPGFIDAFKALMDLGNKCFGREIKPRSRLEDICFGLGHTCRDDFLEVTFLAVNGFGIAASKILRGLYERAVALAYIISDPSKAERIVRFAAVEEHRAMVAALNVVTEEEFDKSFGPAHTATLIRQMYGQVKPEFEITDCKTCGTKRTQANWDLDIPAMVHKVGAPYDQLFLIGYTIPNFNIHATLASLFDGRKDEGLRGKQKRDEGELVLLSACHILFLVVQSQNKIFSLGLDTEMNACEAKLADLWKAHLSNEQSDSL